MFNRKHSIPFNFTESCELTTCPVRIYLRSQTDSIRTGYFPVRELKISPPRLLLSAALRFSFTDNRIADLGRFADR